MICKGFTLIEVLVALSIVAIIGVMSFTGLSTSVKFNDLTLSRMDMSAKLTLADETLMLMIKQNLVLPEQRAPQLK